MLPGDLHFEINHLQGEYILFGDTILTPLAVYCGVTTVDIDKVKNFSKTNEMKEMIYSSLLLSCWIIYTETNPPKDKLVSNKN